MGGHGRRLAAALAGTGVVIAAAAAFLPDLFVDQLLWKHFWGPIAADAAGEPLTRNGVTATAGYTPVSIVTYAFLLVAAVTGIERLLRRLAIADDRGMVLAFIPFIIGAGILRAGADAGVGAGTGLQYLFISPVLYVTMGVVAGAAVAAGWLLQRNGTVSDYRTGIAGAGTVFFAAAGAALVRQAAVSVVTGAATIVGLALLLTAGCAGIARLTQIRWQGVTPGEAGAVLFGHLLDGSSTAVAVSRFGAGEKQPLVAWFIDLTGSAYAFAGLKLVVIAAILYVLNGTAREDDPVFYNLVLLAILALGLGPGVRNTARILFGV